MTRTFLALCAVMWLLASAASGQEPGWHYSSVAGEGDRASMGCDRDASATSFVCLAVRCEDDFTTGVYVLSSTPATDPGIWEFTIDEEDRQLLAVPTDAPYGARFADDADWLLERLKQGTFVYLRKRDDSDPKFRYIRLSGSLAAINAGLYFCAPKVPSAPPVSSSESQAPN